MATMRLSIVPAPPPRPALPALQRSNLSTRQNPSLSDRVSPSPSTITSSSSVAEPLNDRRQSFLSPPAPPNLGDRSVAVRFQLNAPLISSHDQWGTWTALFATGAFGIWWSHNSQSKAFFLLFKFPNNSKFSSTDLNWVPFLFLILF